MLALPVALLAGLVSFASPCVFPLVPGYIGYVAGASADEQSSPARVVGGTTLFVAGFSVVFLLMAFFAGGVGHWLVQHSDVLARVMGGFVVLMGVMFLGWVPGADRQWRLPLNPSRGVWGAPLLGVVFSFGWAPCIGPVFASVLALGGIGGSTGRAVTLAAAYCAGLGVPFVIAAWGMTKGMNVFEPLRRHQRTVQRFGGALLVAVGALLMTGWWNVLVDAMRAPFQGFGTVL